MAQTAIDELRAHNKDAQAFAESLASEGRRLITLARISSVSRLEFDLSVHAVPYRFQRLLHDESQVAVGVALQAAEETLRRVMSAAIEARRVELVKLAAEEARGVLAEIGAAQP